MRALIVDDSKSSRSIVARTLRGARFECLEAANGAEALDVLAATGRPDVVTVNWHMPVMDGIELVKRLRADGPHRDLPLLMISTEHDRDRVAEALAVGVNGYLAKPFTPGALLRKLVDLRVCTEADVAAACRPVRVLVCDDSATIRGLIATTLDRESDVQVSATAVNGRACLDALAKDVPDIVLLDVEMPVMDGITALREIRRLHPKLPVLMFSSLTERGAKATVDALLAGANDYVAKPAGLDAGDVAERIRTEVVGRIRALARRDGRLGAASTPMPAAAAPRPRPAARREAVRGVVIAVSTGGPTALAEVLSACAAGAGVPILVVQHMPAFFTTQLADRLTKLVGVPVAEGTEGMRIAPGSVVLAPGGRHMEVAADPLGCRVRLGDGPPENSCRPAADVLFRSAARLWGPGTLGVVLTGMGRDGLAGSRAVVEAGGAVLAQDEFTSVVWGMPGEVVRAGLADAVLPLGQVGVEIALRLRRRGG
jgi:two-component system chemotaxis response regulator CheB